MAKFIALVSHKGPIPADFADQPAPDPAMFGLPAEDDGSRDDPLLGQNIITCNAYQHDFDALRTAPTRIVIGVGAESGQSWPAGRARPSPSGSAPRPSPSPATTAASSAASTARPASRTPSPRRCARSSPADGPQPGRGVRRQQAAGAGRRGRWPAGSRPAGSSTGAGDRLATQATPPRRRRAPRRARAASPSRRRGRLGAADAQRAAVEREHRAGSPAAPRRSGRSTARLRQPGLRRPGGLKPNGGSAPDHGSGTRQPSRPGSAPPERCQIGSWRSSSGMSSTSHRPSSSPW